MLGVLLFSRQAHSFDTVVVKNITAQPLNKSYRISGATQFNYNYYAVTKNDSNIYLLQNDETQKKSIVSKLGSAIDLKTFNHGLGYYSITKNHELNLEGISACSNVFYLVNENMANLIKVDIADANNKKLTEMKINDGGFEDFKDSSQKGFIQGFIGISADCKGNILYVAKRQTPNKIFVVDISNPKNNHVINSFDLGTELKDNISDLAYVKGLLYVLQKNSNSVFVMQPQSNGKFLEIARYDYSASSNYTRKSDDEGNAEGLIVREKSNGAKQVYLFLDSKNAVLEFQI